MAIGHARKGRLSRAAEFERVYKQGRSFGSRHLVVYLFRSNPEQEARLGLSVGRRVGGAVERNLVKRLVREAFRQGWRERLRGHDVVIVARSEAAALAQRGLAAVQEELDPLLERAVAAKEER